MTVTTYQHGASDTARPSGPSTDKRATSPHRTHATSYAVDKKGNLTARTAVSVNMADVNNGEAGILGTARASGGGPRAVADLRPTDLVTHNGMQMQVAVAEKIGLLVRDANGRYQEAPLKSGEAEPAADSADTTERFGSDESEAALSEIAKGVSQSTQLAALSQVINNGGVSATTLESASREMGIHPDALQAKIGTVMDAFKAQAAASVGCSDAEDFFSWAHENKPNALREAMRIQAVDRSTAGYKSLYTAYLADLGTRNPDAVLNAQFGGGVEAFRKDDKVLLRIPGRGVIEYGQAVRSGIVKVG